MGRLRNLGLLFKIAVNLVLGLMLSQGCKRVDAALTANAELLAKVEALTTQVAELEAKLNEPSKTPDISSVPSSTPAAWPRSELTPS